VVVTIFNGTMEGMVLETIKADGRIYCVVLYITCCFPMPLYHEVTEITRRKTIKLQGMTHWDRGASGEVCRKRNAEEDVPACELAVSK
jgi:hypothetical protein